MWLGLQIVSSLERCTSFRVSFIERFHCIYHSQLVRFGWLKLSLTRAILIVANSKNKVCIWSPNRELPPDLLTVCYKTLHSLLSGLKRQVVEYDYTV